MPSKYKEPNIELFHRLLRERLLSASGTTGEACLLWPRGTNRDGYGIIWDGTKHQQAHRLAYHEVVGKPDFVHCVLHRCDNPRCFLPTHLFLGTNADNVRDRELKNRGGAAFGSANGRAKLTANDVAEIRIHLQAGKLSKSCLAKMYGVSNPLISYIGARKIWRTGASQ